jgi:AraC family transcriptional regulator
MRIYIKNMVCTRCIMAVSKVLADLDLHPMHIELGMVDLAEQEIPPEKIFKLDNSLLDLGFEKIDDRKSRLIEKIKTTVINHIQQSGEEPALNWSSLISDKLHYEYNYLSNLFSSVEGITLEQYILRQKIEKVKELLTYDELTLSEIAWKLGYNSVAHLSSQFRKITGFSPTNFKNMRNISRQSLDNR